MIADPERGFLVVETKAGEINRDATGRWSAGRHHLKGDPFTQAQRRLSARQPVKHRDLDNDRAPAVEVALAVAIPEVDEPIDKELCIDAPGKDSQTPAMTRRMR